MRASVGGVVDAHVQVAGWALGAVVDLEVLAGNDPVEHAGRSGFDLPAEHGGVELGGRFGVGRREVDEDEPQAADEVQQPVDLAVRAILRNGNRMSLFARSLKDSMLIGEHPLLGESKLKLGDVDQLLIGIDINEAGVDQPYGGWRLQDAPEPIIPEAGR